MIITLLISKKNPNIPRSKAQTMSTAKVYKAIVLGSGQGGTPLTMALAAAGHKAALVEVGSIGRLLSSLFYLVAVYMWLVTQKHEKKERIVLLSVDHALSVFIFNEYTSRPSRNGN